MLNRDQIRRAVDMQRRSYRLLRWMAKAVEEGFIQFETAHDYSSLPEAAEAWILRHYLNIPSGARVAREDLSDFCAFFSTYLENSFDLVANPGKQLYSPDAHCFCPMCSWLVNAPHLKTKKLTPSDKRRARTMKAATIRDVAAEHHVGERSMRGILHGVIGWGKDYPFPTRSRGSRCPSTAKRSGLTGAVCWIARRQAA